MNRLNRLSVPAKNNLKDEPCKTCDRPRTIIFCDECKEFHIGRIQRICEEHKNINFLHDWSQCVCGANKSHLYETNLTELGNVQIKKHQN